MVCSRTACSWRAGSSREKARRPSPSGRSKRVEASTSGVRHACICHQSVNAAIQKSASEMTTMNTDVYKMPPTDPPPPGGDQQTPGSAQRAPGPLPPLPPCAHPPVRHPGDCRNSDSPTTRD